MYDNWKLNDDFPNLPSNLPRDQVKVSMLHKKFLRYYLFIQIHVLHVHLIILTFPPFL